MFLFPHGISIEVLYIMIRAIDILVVNFVRVIHICRQGDEGKKRSVINIETSSKKIRVVGIMHQNIWNWILTYSLGLWARINFIMHLFYHESITILRLFRSVRWKYYSKWTIYRDNMFWSCLVYEKIMHATNTASQWIDFELHINLCRDQQGRWIDQNQNFQDIAIWYDENMTVTFLSLELHTD